MQVPTELVQIALKYIDEFIIDIKILDPKECKEVLNGDIELYNQNLKILSDNAKINIFRIPLVNEYTLTKTNVEKILELLKKYKPEKIEIFKIHNLAQSKYKAIGKKIVVFSEIEDKKVEELYNKIKEIDLNVQIIKI